MLNIRNAEKKQTIFASFFPDGLLPHPCPTAAGPTPPGGPRPALTGHQGERAQAGRWITLFFCLALFLAPTTGLAKKNIQFPVYPVIEDNVRFWQDVYGKYNSRQGILHDKDKPAIVYGIIDLVDWNTPGAARINKNLIKLARHRYKKMLNDLGRGKKPRTREEKRIAALFPPKKHTRYLKARDNIRLQIGQKDRFLQGVIRSGAYMPDLQAIFRAHNLPVELAYLPHVESSFNPKAHSKAGAVGLWQFTRGTGRDFMTINSVLDERYDPFLSSQAAAMLLKKNYSQLGSWPLALTAYNYGRAGMVRALRVQKTYENIFKNHKTSIFKFASRNFYSEFVAALRVARKLEKDRSIIHDHPTATLSIRMKGYADTGKIRRYFKLSRKDFARFNPALRAPVLTGKKYIPKGYLLRLPATKFIRGRVKKMGTRFYHSRQIRDHMYTVRRGDTVGSIGRRFGVSTRALIRANNLDRRATIRIGQKLVLPRGKTVKRSKRIPVLRESAKRKP
ncbi:MAG TPA: LysM peptidoglycan-binding domain-containing protein [Desulfobulbus sp.]|nr:LysM peptidoglycan-binding domain-containing protein [Desulfobulbus sp.]